MAGNERSFVLLYAIVECRVRKDLEGPESTLAETGTKPKSAEPFFFFIKYDLLSPVRPYSNFGCRRSGQA
jgi:hypothetical protein